MHDEHPADSRRVLVRAGRGGDDEQRSTRSLIALLGAIALTAVIPLTVLVRREHTLLLDLDRSFTSAAESAVGGSSALLAVSQAVTLLGDPLLMTVLAVLLAGALAGRGHGRLALFVLLARVGAVVLSTVLKAVVDRVRPVFDVPVATETTGSFPSGHALGSAAFYLTAALVLRPLLQRQGRLRWLLVPAAVLAVAVAASRVLLGVHHLSDVVAGLLLGAGWAAVCTALFAAALSTRQTDERTP